MAAHFKVCHTEDIVFTSCKEWKLPPSLLFHTATWCGRTTCRWCV